MSRVESDAVDLAALTSRVDRLISERSGRRVLIGIVGAPASGKTTLAHALVAALVEHEAPWAPAFRVELAADPSRPWIGSHVAHVPMDGYHLADIELRRLGRDQRKGAPDTFDARGYAALLRRLRECQEDVWAPAFDRDVEQPVSGSIPVPRSSRVVITEGNYLLLDAPEWRDVRELLDEVWFCEVDTQLRQQRLIARHIRFGKTPQAAAAWTHGPDQRNAELIECTRSRADLVLTCQ